MEKLTTMPGFAQIHHTSIGTHYTIGTPGTPSYTTTGTGTSHNMYSTPVLIDTIVTKDYIELVYKRQYMVSLGYGMPNPEIYKDVYSRNDGSVRRVIGTYISAQLESYEFEDL
jgi:hypothetical protein